MMFPKDEIHGCQCGLLDMLSMLPVNVINIILMHLMCCCSDKNLVEELGLQVVQTIRVETLCNTTKGKKSPAIQFDNIFKHLLAHLAGPIMKFSIDITGLESWPVIHKMTYFLSRNGIQHLVLKLPLGCLYELPYSVYCCLELKHLSVENCPIFPSLTFKGFDKLISLELSGIGTISFFLECLVSHCPLLEQFLLHKLLTDERVIEISSPMLKSFDFTGNLSSICLKNIPLLEKLSLTSTDSFVGVNDNDDEVPALEALEVECFADVTFKHLKEVELKGSLRTKPQMQLIKLLLLKSPELVKMLIMHVLESESLG
ncbi:hypothetical protein H5410_027478 [Solanum commersonii]|uniref:F-box/LRR-repeat protein 15/At3g58940/PEG3-like LRR domain-containing protein n=1 Tax=Solanum commersonii TaxID=4109 RepID=A0A9J5YZY8_SOLCO|nr:hypothetical protein H5410_027478 [Solanum commersonii]